MRAWVNPGPHFFVIELVKVLVFLTILLKIEI